MAEVDDLKLSIAGSGEMDLDQITANRGELEIAGSGTMRAGSVTIGDLEDGASPDRAAPNSSRSTRAPPRSEIAGSGTVIAKGAVDDLKIEIAGSGRADFGEVASRTAESRSAAMAMSHIAPSEEAKIEISGSGDVCLHSDPKSWRPRSAARAASTGPASAS